MNSDKPVIAIAGAGRMGIGMAQVFAYAGFTVALADMKERCSGEAEQVLGSARRQIKGNLELLASLGLMDGSVVETILSRISFCRAAQLEEAVGQAGVVFEAVPEVLAVKEKVLGRIGFAAGDQALIASTTSTFLVDTLAGYVRNPARFLNTHWLNPAYLIPLVEVSPGDATSPGALEFMLRLLEEAGKVPVKCTAAPGFIVPRIQALAMNEAARLVEEGVATPEDIDKASRIGFGLRFAVLGLLEFIDWGGGDILYYADHYLKESLKADRFTPPEVINENMKKGHTGMRAGRGFYDFSERDVNSYQQETIKKLVDLLRHLGLLRPPKKV